MISDYDRKNVGNIIAGEGDWFTAQLLRLFHKADSYNRYRLGSAFPKELEAYEAWLNGPGP